MNPPHPTLPSTVPPLLSPVELPAVLPPGTGPPVPVAGCQLTASRLPSQRIRDKEVLRDTDPDPDLPTDSTIVDEIREELEEEEHEKSEEEPEISKEEEREYFRRRSEEFWRSRKKQEEYEEEGVEEGGK